MNLSQLKKNADKYTFTMIQHSWENLFCGKPGKLIGLKRKVELKRTNSIRFEGGSWLYLDRASSFRFENETSHSFTMLVDLRQDGRFAETMTYQVESIHSPFNDPIEYHESFGGK